MKKKMTIQTNTRTKSPFSDTESPKLSLVKKRLTIHTSASEYEPSAKRGTTSLSDRFGAQPLPQVSSTTKKKIVPKVQRISVQVPNDTKKLATRQKQAVVMKQKPVSAVGK
jgi:hypothetical protein